MRLSRFAIDLSRFSERHLIARGAFGQVFSGTDPTNGETAAILFRTNLAPGDDQQQTFQELECLAGCAHPSLLRLIGFCLNPSPGVPLGIATEFQPNGSLAESLNRERKGELPILNATQKSKVIFGVVVGMAFLHGVGILHRDLKPDNILLNNQFEPVIGDFGVSCYFENIANRHMQVGTPLFMAPELLNDDPCDFASDVYSFAVTLYSIFSTVQEMDDGKGFFRTNMNLMMRIQGGARFVRKVEISDAMWEIIESCWMEDPNGRPTFQGLLDSFRGGRRYVLDGADRNAIIEYENRVYGQFGPPNRGKLDL
jgi:serine/threonine protein kinase